MPVSSSSKLSKLKRGQLHPETPCSVSLETQFNVQKKRDGTTIRRDAKFMDGQWMLLDTSLNKYQSATSFPFVDVLTGQRSTVSLKGKEANDGINSRVIILLYILFLLLHPIPSTKPLHPYCERIPLKILSNTAGGVGNTIMKLSGNIQRSHPYINPLMFF